MTKDNTINPCSSSTSCSNVLTFFREKTHKRFKRFAHSPINKNNCYYLLHAHEPELAIGKDLLSANIGLKAITAIISFLIHVQSVLHSFW